ncbi:hypothetical protein AAVH_16712 [Aphelenchoides avenae]|nr:hypothetical protein AAVH_16712 [Aphelenchus avenae]
MTAHRTKVTQTILDHRQHVQVVYEEADHGRKKQQGDVYINVPPNRKRNLSPQEKALWNSQLVNNMVRNVTDITDMFERRASQEQQRASVDHKRSSVDRKSKKSTTTDTSSSSDDESKASESKAGPKTKLAVFVLKPKQAGVTQRRTSEQYYASRKKQ